MATDFEISAFLSCGHPLTTDFSLDRVFHLLDILDNPHKCCPPVIHVAGTNGKGSTIAFMRSMLEAAGYRVHVYTSPHLVRFNERIRLDGALISDEMLYALSHEVREKGIDPSVTFFELTTAVAFLAFSRHPADILLLETGMGGLLDATNVFASPVATVITSISRDHEFYLGNTLEKIAMNKAGIMKESVPCFSASQSKEALAVLRARARELSVPFYQEGVDWCIRGHSVSFGGMDFDLRGMALTGEHQYRNAALAMAVMRGTVMRACRHEAIFKEGIESVCWPARLENLSGTILPSCIGLSPDQELWLDGGHNEAAAEILSSHIEKHWDERPVYLVVGMLSNRDVGKFLSYFVGKVSAVFGTEIPLSSNSHSVNEIVSSACHLGFDTAGYSDPLAAVAAAADTDGNARILICGSLYLAGFILQRLRDYERKELSSLS